MKTRKVNVTSRRWFAVPALLAAIAPGACARDTPEPRAVVPASIAPAQFRSLSWLEGRWRGTDGSAPFYEAYRVIDDSTIRSFDYPDSTFSAPSDSGAVRLRGDTVFSGSPARQYVAVALDSTRVTFEPWRGAANGFTWQRDQAGGWTATLTWDSAGIAMKRVYEMRRVP